MVSKRSVVIVVLDGTRRDMVNEEMTPSLAALARRSAWFDAHRSAFPSATRVVSASFATGCRPGRNELMGNSMALLEPAGLVAHDAGDPEFLQHKRRVTGRSLAVPTLAERLAPIGGMISYSNVSPGAAYAHDPDGHGHVLQRVGSYGPGRVRLSGAAALDVAPGIAGDEAMTTRFIGEVLGDRKPPLAMIWMADPDLTQHARPLGSPEHLALLRRADANARRVFAAVEKRRAGGEEVLLIVCSDHGHQTVGEVIDVDGELIAAGLKQSRTSRDVVAPSSGTSILVHVDETAGGRVEEIGAFLRSRPWAERIVAIDEMAAFGLAPHHALAFAVSMRADEEPNAFGIPGRSAEALPAPGKAAHLHCGQHGGLARYEQAPFLIVSGDGFGEGVQCRQPTAVIDIAPTVLRHLQQPTDGMDGEALQGSGAVEPDRGSQ